MNVDELPILIKQSANTFIAATDADVAKLERFKLGQGVRFETKAVKPRSLQFHRKYWAGLVALVMDYWEPTGGLINDSERKMAGFIAQSFASDFDVQESAIQSYVNAILEDIAHKRQTKVGTIHKTASAIHKWLKIEAGFYELHKTPNGYIKVEQSINFNSMNGDKFSEFYKAVLDVAWKYILKNTFETADDADNAVSQLLDLG